MREAGKLWKRVLVVRGPFGLQQNSVLVDVIAAQRCVATAGDPAANSTHCNTHHHSARPLSSGDRMRIRDRTRRREAGAVRCSPFSTKLSGPAGPRCCHQSVLTAPASPLHPVTCKRSKLSRKRSKLSRNTVCYSALPCLTPEPWTLDPVPYDSFLQLRGGTVTASSLPLRHRCTLYPVPSNSSLQVPGCPLGDFSGASRWHGAHVLQQPHHLQLAERESTRTAF